MSLISDFDLAWKSYEDKLTSYVAQNSNNNKMINADDFNNHYKRTIRMWDDESKVQGGFVNKWDKEFPGFRNEFFSIMNDYQFQTVEAHKKPSFIPYIAILVAIMAAGGIIGYLIPASFILKRLIGNILVVIIAVIVFAVTGGGILKALYENSVSKSCSQFAVQFNSQIENLHTKLRNLCSKY